MSRVLCFGELLLRFSPQLKGEWIRQNTMPVYIGGAELNVATALSRWGLPVSYCTALPDNYLSGEIRNALEGMRIGTDRIVYKGNRIGTYYLPQGADLKNAGVIYDRAHSAFWDLKPGQLNWDQVLEDVNWFHFSAISPALNQDLAAVCKEGAEAAVRKNIKLSIDLNYRPRLWQYGKEPSAVMPELVKYCDLVMGNIWAEEKMLGISLPPNLGESKQAYLEASLAASENICKRYPRCSQVANTFRFDQEEGIRYYATLYTEGKLFVSHEQQAENIIDKVGSGDTFMAGLIYGNQLGWSPQERIHFAAAAAFQKLFIRGDATTSTVEEIRKGYLNYA